MAAMKVRAEPIGAPLYGRLQDSGDRGSERPYPGRWHVLVQIGFRPGSPDGSPPLSYRAACDKAFVAGAMQVVSERPAGHWCGFCATGGQYRDAE
jgi:hypothetical protein